MITEEKLIRHCLEQIERTLNWGPADRWSNQDFEKLGDLIVEKTKIKLSVSTLKRIWGKVQYFNLPSVTTLNALAQFSGYENWRQYWQKNSIIESPLQVSNSNGSWWHRPVLRRIVFTVVLIILGLFIYLASRFI